MFHLEQPDQINYEVRLQGLSEETIRGISQQLQEPQRMLEQRMAAWEIFQQKKNPEF